MSYMAQWGPKGFLLSPTKIIPLNDFSTRLALKSDSENDTSGTAPTNTRGRELQSISFTTEYIRAAGVDPRAQLTEWENLLGESHPLYIGDKRFGPESMILKEVVVSELVLSNSGDFLSVVIDIILEEESNGQTSKLTKKSSKKAQKSKTSASAKKASDTYKKTVEKQKAMKATASANDRNTKKLTAMEKRLMS